MAIPSIQTSFNAGELAPSLWGHVDFAKFAMGASTMRNMIVNYKGGAYSRAGSAFVGYSKQTTSGMATGTIHFSVNPTAGDTVTLNGVAYTFISGSTSGTNIHIEASLSLTLTNLIIALDASVNPAITVASYTGSGGPIDTLVVTFKTGSTAGNLYTLAASAATPSGPTLSGGGAYPPRLVTFQFNLNQGLVLEFGQRYMRVISQGAFVTETGIAITGATQADPCIVGLSSAAGLNVGDWMFISGVVGMNQLNGRTFVISAIAGNNITLSDVFGNGINSVSYGAYVSGGTAARIYTLATPYNAVDLPFLKFTQSADVMSLTLRNQQTGTEYPPYDLGRIADDNWTLTELSTGTTISPPTNVAAAETTSSVGTLVSYSYGVTSVDAVSGQESVVSAYASCQNVDISAQAGANKITWDNVAAAGYFNIYKAPPAYATTTPIGALYGFAGSSFGNSFIDGNIVADFSLVPPLHQNPFLPGQALSVTITNPGTGNTGPMAIIINTSTGSGATGYGVLDSSGEMLRWVFTSPGGNYALTDTVLFTDLGAGTATGNIAFATNPTAGDTATFNGVAFTFISGPTSGTNIHIEASLSLTLFNLIVALQGSANPSITVATYTGSGSPIDQVNVTYKTSGSVGNSYTLAASAATPSGPTLTGGTGGTVPTGTLNVGPQTGTYPSVAAYFQERRAYANTANQPDTYWMSQPGAFTNFDSRIPSTDTDAIVGTPWSVQVDGIQFMLPLIASLIVLTGQAAYVVGGTGTSPTSPQPITPSSQQALPQAYNGCHFHVPPVKIDYDIYYLQAKGSVIRSLSYNFWINTFTGVDVTILSSQLFTGYGINAMAWCEEPYKVLWAVRSDGVLLSLTTMKAQDVMGWARHDTQGLFVDCTSVTEPPVDALYVTTQRFVSGGRNAYMIERMDDRIWASVEECWCVDAGLALPQTAGVSDLTITGNYNGSGVPTSVADLIGGTGYSSQTVVTINDPTGAGCTVTPTIVNGVIIALAFSGGSLYTRPQLQFSDPGGGGGSGASGTVVLTNTVTVTSDASIFSSGSVGNVIRGGGGVFQITAFSTATTVTAAVLSPPTAIIPGTTQPFPLAAGGWTIATPVTAVTGLDHLEGLTVTGLADGNVIPPATVTNGAIALANPATAVIVGLPFIAQLQSLYLEGGTPTEQGRRKKIGAVTVRLDSSGAFEAGSNQPDGSAQSPIQIQANWTNLKDVAVAGPNLAQIPYGTAEIAGTTYVRPVPLYTGDVRHVMNSAYAKPGQVAVQQTDPLPLNVIAFIRESELGDTPENTPRPNRESVMAAQ